MTYCTWRDIEGWNNRYMVSDSGRVWDKKHWKDVSVLKSGLKGNDYYYVNLSDDSTGKRKLVRVHRLMAEAFLPRTPEERETKNIVDHIDRDRFNNHISNLRWVCRKGNQRNTKRTRYNEAGVPLAEVIERKFGSVQPHLGNIYSRVNNGLCLEDALFEYEYKLETGEDYSKWLSYIEQKYECYGTKISMQELVEEKGLVEEDVVTKTRSGWTVEEIMSGHKWYDGKYSFVTTNSSCTGTWWPTKARCMSAMKIGDGIWDRAATDADGRLDILAAKKEVENLYKKEWVINGITYFDSFEGLCRKFNKDYSAVNTRRMRQGMTLEEALTTEPKRINYYILDGEIRLPSGETLTFVNEKVKPIHLMQKLNLSSRYFNGKNKQNREEIGCAVKALIETLNYFDADTSNLSVAL